MRRSSAPKKTPTIRFAELKRLSFCNSPRLPRRVIVDGRMLMWVGFGWIDVDDEPRTGKEPVVVEDE